MASGHVNRTKRPNTWLHRPTLQNVKKALANPEPSTHGTFGTATGPDDVHFQGKTGSSRPTAKVTRLTRIGHPTFFPKQDAQPEFEVFRPLSPR